MGIGMKARYKSSSLVTKSTGYIREYKCSAIDVYSDVILVFDDHEEKLVDYYADDCVIAVFRDSYHLYVITIADSTESKTSLFILDTYEIVE